MSIASRLFLKWWDLPPMAQMAIVLGAGAIWVVVSAWRRESKERSRWM